MTMLRLPLVDVFVYLTKEVIEDEVESHEDRFQLLMAPVEVQAIEIDDDGVVFLDCRQFRRSADVLIELTSSIDDYRDRRGYLIDDFISGMLKGSRFVNFNVTFPAIEARSKNVPGWVKVVNLFMDSHEQLFIACREPGRILAETHHLGSLVNDVRVLKELILIIAKGIERMSTAEATKREVRRITLVEACKLADYLRTNPACIAARQSVQGYQQLAEWIAIRPDWCGAPVPVGSLQSICEEYGLPVGPQASEAVDTVAREAISKLSKAVLDFIDDPSTAFSVKIAVDEASKYTKPDSVTA